MVIVGANNGGLWDSGAYFPENRARYHLLILS